MDIRKAIDTTPMSGFQWYIVGLATFLNALDGYDVLAMAFTANAVSGESDSTAVSWVCCSARVWSAWPWVR